MNREQVLLRLNEINVDSRDIELSQGCDKLNEAPGDWTISVTLEPGIVIDIWLRCVPEWGWAPVDRMQGEQAITESVPEVIDIEEFIVCGIECLELGDDLNCDWLRPWDRKAAETAGLIKPWCAVVERLMTPKRCERIEVHTEWGEPNGSRRPM